jgi:hypothetical protein
MPRLPINYEKTIIYKIVCNDLSITECYVGHTTDYARRKHCHKHYCSNDKHIKYDTKIYKAIRDNGGWTNWSMFEIEKHPCKDAYEACIRERYYYELLHSSLNMKFPQRDRKEYYAMNKEYLGKIQRIYETSHKEEIKEKRGRLLVCECGLEINYSSKLRHLKTKIHNDLMLSKNETPVSG